MAIYKLKKSQELYYQVKEDPVESTICNEGVKVYVRRKGVLEHNVIHLYHLISGQSILALQPEKFGIDKGRMVQGKKVYGKHWKTKLFLEMKSTQLR